MARNVDKRKDRRLREGCLICKLRHLKCDGIRPQCQNCREAQRRCVGFSDAGSPAGTVPSTRNANRLSPSPMNWPQWTHREVRSFHYGLNKTIPNLTFYFESDFWGVQIPKLAHNIPAVRHALNALASFHEKAIPSRTANGEHYALLNSTSVDNFFLQQYNKAIEGLRQYFVDRGLSKPVCILVCCALFVCLEGLHSRYRAMVNHLRNGLKVFHEWVSTKHQDTEFTAGSIEASVYETFLRVDYHAAAFLDDHVPSQPLKISQRLPAVNPMSPEFVHILQARNHIDSLYGQTFLFLKSFNSARFEHIPKAEIPSKIMETHEMLALVTTKCSTAIDKFDQRYSGVFTSRETRSMIMLKIRIKIICIFVWKWPYEHASYPELEVDFQSILDLSRLMIQEHLYGSSPRPPANDEADSPENSSSAARRNSSSSSSSSSSFDEPPVFTLEVGILPILYYVGLSSSTSTIRSEAVCLLRSVNLREGLWSSSRTADMVEARLKENDWQQSPVTGVEMSELSKKLWHNLQTEEEENSMWN